MKKSRLFAVLTSGAALSLMLSLGPTANAATPSVKYGGVLHIVMPWPPFTGNFNPLNPDSNSATVGGTGSAIYEPLAYVNQYTGDITPMLASAWAWSDGGKTLTLTTQTGVSWTDGKPFSAADVAFTFNYIKAHPSSDLSGIWKDNLVSVSVAGANSVVLKFSTSESVDLPFVLQQEIVPKHIWSKVGNPTTFTNPHPVGTGPFMLAKNGWNPTTVTYVKNPNYWQAGKPYINGITMTAVKSNDTAELLVLNGDAAWTYTELTDPAKTYTPIHPWDKYWWPVTGLNLLYFNTTQAPFTDPVLRKAIAMSINDTVASDRAYYGAIPGGAGPVETAVTNGQTSEWVPSSLSSLEWTYDPAGALSLLEAHGYKLVGGALVDPAGATLPAYKILIGGPGWTDYISMAQTISQELASIGIQTTIDQEVYSTYAADLAGGTYNMAISWTNGNNATPYYEYSELLGYQKAGEITSNWSQYNDTTINSALAAYASSTSLAAQKTAMVAIEKDVLTNVPVVSITGRPNFFDYSTRYFTGWPSATDPYTAGESPDGGNNFATDGAEQVFLNVHLK